MRTAVGIISWQDGNEAIKRTVESAQHFADEIIIAEGPIEAYFDKLQDNTFTGEYFHQLATPNYTGLGDKVFYHSQRSWKTESAKKQFCLTYARMFKCDWILWLDTDEYLVNPDQLWEWLMFIYGNDLAAPIVWHDTENNGVNIPAPWKLLNVNQCKAIVARSYVVRTFSGKTYDLTSDCARSVTIDEIWPYIVHDPSIRPEWRKSFRLGPVEDTLEKMPEKVSAYKCPLLPTIVRNGIAR